MLVPWNEIENKKSEELNNNNNTTSIFDQVWRYIGCGGSTSSKAQGGQRKLKQQQ